MSKTCFVIMPIGDQKYGRKTITKEMLKSSYNDLIKEAILKANPNLEVIRADEVTSMGNISTDILARIMFSDYVIADISYPNPNVFYELGLRHAVKNQTILLKEENVSKIPFDISHLRCIHYYNTPHGLKQLSEELKKVFDNYESNPGTIDNSFLDLARTVNFQYPSFSDNDENIKKAFMLDLIYELAKHEDFFEFISELLKKGFNQDQIGIEILKYIISKEDKELFQRVAKFGLMLSNK